VEHALPIHAQRDTIMSEIWKHQIVVIVGETGCGKTTLLPRFSYEEGFAGISMVGTTVPRRIAAIGASTFVSESHYKESVGGFVGYQIRNERIVDDKVTKIKYMTDGVLLREIASDPLLLKYSVIIIDETHERNVNQEVLMALLRNVSRQRPDLKLIVMSATIDERRFAHYFRAPVITVPGRTFPIEVVYTPRELTDTIPAAASAVVEAGQRMEGDTLVFVPDYEAIEKVIMDLRSDPRARSLFTGGFLPLYGNQSPAEHRAIFARHDGTEGEAKRFVIVATNIAETSVTLDGVGSVVDTGLVKEMRYHPRTGHSTLDRKWHSQAGCDQRKGRCGRTRPGLCIRLFTEDQFEAMNKHTTPEILRSDLSQVALQLVSAGFTFDRVTRLDYMARPNEESWTAAKRTLVALGAMDAKTEELTTEGRRMAAIPLPPAMAKMVLAAGPLGCQRPVTVIASSFVTHRVFLRPPEERKEADAAHETFADRMSDFVALYRAYRAWKKAPDQEAFAKEHYLHHDALTDIDKTTATVTGILSTLGETPSDQFIPERIGMAVTAGLAPLTMLKYDADEQCYRTPDGKPVSIFPGSFLRDVQPPKRIVAAEIVKTRKRYALNVQAVPDSWLKHLPFREQDDEPTRLLTLRGDKKKQQRRVEKKRRNGRYTSRN